MTYDRAGAAFAATLPARRANGHPALFGSSRMDAYCPNCGRRWSTNRVSGRAVSALLRRRRGARQNPTAVQHGDHAHAGKPEVADRRIRRLIQVGQLDGADQIREAEKLLKPEIATDKTKAEGKLPRAVVLRLNPEKRPDPAHVRCGREYFSSPERIQELRYLNKAATFILVIDPLSVEAFWDRLLPSQQSTLTLMRSTILELLTSTHTRNWRAWA